MPLSIFILNYLLFVRILFSIIPVPLFAQKKVDICKVVQRYCSILHLIFFFSKICWLFLFIGINVMYKKWHLMYLRVRVSDYNSKLQIQFGNSSFWCPLFVEVQSIYSNWIHQVEESIEIKKAIPMTARVLYTIIRLSSLIFP